MAISKLILNGEVQMDVTSDTVIASSLLSGKTATKNDGTKITGNIASKSSDDLTVSGATVTAPAGYYANAASKAVTTTTHPNPSASITSSTGVVTASHTQGTGYVTGGTTTGTLNLTTQAGKTVTPTESAQTAVASYRWTTGNVNVAAISSTYVGTGVTTRSAADMTVAAQSVTAPAGYYSQAFTKAVTTTTHLNPTATIVSSTGVVTATHTQTAGYVTAGTTTGTLNLTTQAGKTVTPTESVQTAVASYRWTTGNINIAAISSTYVGTGVTTRSSTDLTASGSVVTAPAGYYSTAATKSIAAGSAFPPAVTITKAPTIGVNTSGVVTASYTGSSSITPTVTSGYISQGTAGTISTTGTSTYQLTSQAATTYYPSTADQTIASQRWLVGNQTIKSVTTSNLTAANIADGVVVKVGDSSNASRITQVTGTHKGGNTYTCTITKSGTNGSVYVTYNGISYYTADTSFDFAEGDTIQVYAIRGETNYFTVNDKVIAGGVNQGVSSYTFTLPAHSVNISFTSSLGESRVAITIPYTYEQLYPREYIAHYVEVEGSSTYVNTLRITNNTSGKVETFFGTTSMINLGALIDYDEGDSLTLYVAGRLGAKLYINDTKVGDSGQDTTLYYSWTAPAANASIKIVPTSSSCTVYIYIDNSTAEGGFTIDQIAMRSISGTISGNTTSIGAYAFAYCSNLNIANFSLCTWIGSAAFSSCTNLTAVSFPICSQIGESAFYNCSKLTTMNFPSCKAIGSFAFSYCYSLSIASFPSCTWIGMSAFCNCSSLTTVSFPKCSSIGNYAFNYCYSLSIASFPSCTSIGSSAFAYCSILATVSFPSCTFIGNYAFNYCSILTTVNFPACQTVSSYAFTQCYSLTTVSLPSCSIIASYAFRYCYHLLSVYLLGSSVVSLVHVSAFLSTPISNYTTSTGGVYGSIFVPASLYNSYKTATNWSVYSARFVSV